MKIKDLIAAALVAIGMFAIMMALSGCHKSSSRDNPLDPGSPNYVTATPTPGQ